MAGRCGGDHRQPEPPPIVMQQPGRELGSSSEREIATWIVAATPANPRRHLVRVGTAYYTDNEGLPICPECFPEYEQEQRMIWEIAQRMFVQEDGQELRPGAPR